VELRRVAERPTREELRKRLEQRGSVRLKSSVAELVAEERQAR
jgi:hypothetical protein